MLATRHNLLRKTVYSTSSRVTSTIAGDMIRRSAADVHSHG